MSATRSILAPLTTTFTPPPDCSTYGASGGLSTEETYWQAQSCSSGLPHDAASCWPPVLATTKSGNLNGWGFYSPGLMCPSGYYSACTAALSKNGSPSPFNLGTSFKFQFPLTAGETAIGCCPQGLTCSVGYGGAQTCATVQTTGQIPNLVGFCPDSSTAYYTGQRINVGIAYTPAGDNSTTITLSSATLFAPLIQLVFKSSDIPSLAAPTSFSTTKSTATIQTGTYGNPGSSGDNNGNTAATDAGGLSTGAKIGIGVGVPLAVLIIAAIAAFFILRRRKSRRNHGPVPGSAFQGTAEKPAGEYVQANYPVQHDNYASQHQAQHKPAAVGATDSKWANMAEAPDTQRAVELDNMPLQQRPVELPTSSSGADSRRA